MVVKVFFVYACDNEHGRVPDIYFGHEENVLGPHQLRDKMSCALDVIGLQLSQGNERYYVLNAILTIIHRTNHKEFFYHPMTFDKP